MERVTFDQLLELYRNTEFLSVGREGLLSVSTEEIRGILGRIDADPREADRIGFAFQDDISSCEVGDKINVEVGSPRPGIGILVDKFDDLLRSPEACFSEPQNYFVIEYKIHRKTSPPHRLQTIYRQVLAVISIIAEAATFADRTRRELVFIGDGRTVIPALFQKAELDVVDLGQCSKFLSLFDSVTHRDQKLGILNATIVRMVQSLPRESRLHHLLSNLDVINDDIQNGYRLFASSFSYSKVRSELAAAKLEFTGKIHKTIVDIQGQLLGIPAATIIVATQMKEPGSCLQSWTNTAIIVGAWLFVVLLLLSLINQWLTLAAISAEISRQKQKLETDYADLGSELTSTFNGVADRICWHRIALVIIGLVSCGGAMIASAAYIYIKPLSNICS